MSRRFFLTAICWLLAIAGACGLAVHVVHLGWYIDTQNAQIQMAHQENYALWQENERLIREREAAVAEADYYRELSREAETIRLLDAMSEPPPELRAKWRAERSGK